MSQENLPRAQTVPEYWNGPEEEHRRKLGAAIGQLQKGVTNNHYCATLEVNATTTEVLHPPARSGSTVLLTPASASAATSFSAGVVWVEAIDGKAVIHHDSSSVTDRRFHLAFLG